MKLSDLGTFHIALFMHKFRNVRKNELAKSPLQPRLQKSLTTKQPKNDISKEHSSKLRQGKLREITKCLLTRF